MKGECLSAYALQNQGLKLKDGKNEEMQNSNIWQSSLYSNRLPRAQRRLWSKFILLPVSQSNRYKNPAAW